MRFDPELFYWKKRCQLAEAVIYTNLNGSSDADEKFSKWYNFKIEHPYPDKKTT